jgi:hypothetical protein
MASIALVKARSLRQGSVIFDQKAKRLAGSPTCDENLRRFEFCNLKHGITRQE